MTLVCKDKDGKILSEKKINSGKMATIFQRNTKL